jgi:hypothetical protein
VGIINSGLSIAPQSADLNAAAAWVYVTQMATTDVPIGDKNLPIENWQNRGGLYGEAKFAKIKPIAKNYVSRALSIQSGHPEALEAGEKIVLLELSMADLKRKNAEHEEAKKNASSCFIATAAYGTPFAKEIDVLRNWRDDFLEASYPGRWFIKTYYTLSPSVADNISGSSRKRKLVRTVLAPIVKILEKRHSN